MYLSNLIQQLQAYKRKHGDRPIADKVFAVDLQKNPCTNYTPAGTLDIQPVPLNDGDSGVLLIFSSNQDYLSEEAK
jgi:hypothetical protein